MNQNPYQVTSTPLPISECKSDVQISLGLGGISTFIMCFVTGLGIALFVGWEEFQTSTINQVFTVYFMVFLSTCFAGMGLGIHGMYWLAIQTGRIMSRPFCWMTLFMTFGVVGVYTAIIIQKLLPGFGSATFWVIWWSSSSMGVGCLIMLIAAIANRDDDRTLFSFVAIALLSTIAATLCLYFIPEKVRITKGLFYVNLICHGLMMFVWFIVGIRYGMTSKKWGAHHWIVFSTFGWWLTGYVIHPLVLNWLSIQFA